MTAGSYGDPISGSLRGPLPANGPESPQQPNGITERMIGEPFAYRLPQITIFFSLFSAAFGILTVMYFASCAGEHARVIRTSLTSPKTPFAYRLPQITIFLSVFSAA